MRMSTLDKMLDRAAKTALRNVIKSICKTIRRDRAEENRYWNMCEGKTARESRSYELAAEEYHNYVRAERGALRDVVKMYMEF